MGPTVWCLPADFGSGDQGNGSLGRRSCLPRAKPSNSRARKFASFRGDLIRLHNRGWQAHSRGHAGCGDCRRDRIEGFNPGPPHLAIGVRPGLRQRAHRASLSQRRVRKRARRTLTSAVRAHGNSVARSAIPPRTSGIPGPGRISNKAPSTNKAPPPRATRVLLVARTGPDGRILFGPANGCGRWLIEGSLRPQRLQAPPRRGAGAAAETKRC